MNKEGIKILKELLKNIIIIGLVLILIEVSYSKFIEKENPVKLFGYAFLVVTTGSMEPEIEAGELIIIKESKDYKKGDIVTFIDQDGFLVTHRIVELQKKFMITKGDNNDLKDEINSIENIKGKVVVHSKILGIFVLYILKPLIFFYIIFLLIITVIKIFLQKKAR